MIDTAWTHALPATGLYVQHGRMLYVVEQPHGAKRFPGRRIGSLQLG